MTLARLDYLGAYSVAENMRAADKEEIYATRWDETPEALARDAMCNAEFAWIAWLGDTPVCAFGAIALHPGVWSIWMFATDDFPKVAFGVTKFIIKVLKPVLTGGMAHRIECRSHANHTTAHKWLELIGLSRESEIPKFGKNKEKFYLYSWLSPE